jgi:hypothetical protein
MKYLEFVLLAMTISLSFAVLDGMGLDLTRTKINTTATDTLHLSRYSVDIIDDNGIFCDYGLDENGEQKSTFSCNMKKYTRDKELANDGFDTELGKSADNDFLGGIGMIVDIFSDGLWAPGNIFAKFFDSSNCRTDETCDAYNKMIMLKHLINAMMRFMYLIAIIQIIAGMSVETNK